MARMPLGRAQRPSDAITGGDPYSYDPRERNPLDGPPRGLLEDLFTFDDIEYFEVNDDDIAFD